MLVGIALYSALLYIVFAYFAMNDPIKVIYVSAFSFYIFSIVAWRKAISLGLENVRARLIAFLGTGGFLIALGFTFQGTLAHVFSVVGYTLLIVGILMMFINLYRMGYTLEISEWIQVISVFLLVLGISLYLGLNYGFSPYGWLLTILSLAVIFLSSSVLRIFWGSDLGRRWMLGVTSAFIFGIATVLLASYMSSELLAFYIVSNALYVLSGLLMSILYSLPG